MPRQRIPEPPNTSVREEARRHRKSCVPRFRKKNVIFSIPLAASTTRFHLRRRGRGAHKLRGLGAQSCSTEKICRGRQIEATWPIKRPVAASNPASAINRAFGSPGHNRRNRDLALGCPVVPEERPRPARARAGFASGKHFDNQGAVGTVTCEM